MEALRYLEDGESNEVMYGGAARGGKSQLGCTWKIIRRLAYPKSFGLVSRAEYSRLRDTTQRTYLRVLSDLGLKRDVDYKAVGVPMTIEFSNGSVEYFREIKYIPSDPEFDRLGSYDLTDALLDEAQQIHYKAAEVLKGRFSETNGDGWSTIPKVLYTCNPAKNWVYSKFVKPHKENKLKPRYKFVKALPSDNPYVPQSFFDNLMSADETTKQRLLYGNFEYDDDPTKLSDYDAICDMFTNDHVAGGAKRISSDLSMQGRDRFVTGAWSGLIVKVAIDKEKATGKEIEDDLRELKIKTSCPNTSIVADSDGLGNYLESYLRNILTFHGGASAYSKKEYFNLKSECAFKLAEMINKRLIKVICTLDQEERIKEEISACLKRDNVNVDKKRIISKDDMKKQLGHSPDYLDMLIMGMIFHVKPVVRSAPSSSRRGGRR